MKILMLVIQLANMSIRCSSCPQGKTEASCEHDGNIIWAWILSLCAHASSVLRLRGTQLSGPSYHNYEEIRGYIASAADLTSHSCCLSVDAIHCSSYKQIASAVAVGLLV